MTKREDLGIITPEDMGAIGLEKRRIALARRQQLAAQIDNPDHRRWMLGTLARAANHEADAQTFYNETHASPDPGVTDREHSMCAKKRSTGTPHRKLHRTPRRTSRPRALNAMDATPWRSKPGLCRWSDDVRRA